MNKLFITLIAGTFAGAVAAQGTGDAQMTPKQQQQAARATTSGSASGASTAAIAKQQEANVKASKSTDKMTTAEKNKAIKDVNAQMVNPNNSSGVDATAKMQKENTAASKNQPRQKVDLNTPEAQKALRDAASK